MKKFTFLFAVLFFASVVNLLAQTDLYNNDFEAYTVGGKLAQQAGAPWTTWSIAPGGTEDPAISSTQAHGGTKSVYVVNNNDLVYQFNDKTTGRFMTEWYMYVESGKLGYFNFLSDFAGSNSKWAFQAFVIHDSIMIDANGTGVAKTTYSSNTWHRMQLFTDVDDDFATLYVDGTELVSYQWSKGAQGTDDSHKLDGINFFGWNTGGTSGYYIDDLNIDSVSAPNSPSNLVAALNGANIDVNWSAPTPAPDLYKLSCNGNVVSATTGLTYTNVGPWPGTYRYVARAHYTGQGYSHASNVDSATIAGGVTRNLVLMEGGTGTWCTYCPGAAMGLNDLIEVNNKDAVAIEYHNYNSVDTLEIPEGVARIAYYGMTGFPTVVADGKLIAVGGNHTTSLYPTYLEMYNQRIVVPGHHILNVSVVETSFDNYTATITIQQTFQALTSGIKLHTAVTESNLPYAWQNQTKVDYACRAMFPDENGTNLDFSVQNPITKTINFNLGGRSKANCEFVVFVQYDALKEVTQTAKVDMSSVAGIEEESGQSISIYPNPANEYIIANTSGKGKIEIFDMTGKLVSSAALKQSSQIIDLRSLTGGIYFVKVSTDQNTFTKKLVIE